LSKQPCQFTQGFVCACAILARWHGEPYVARDILNITGLGDRKKLAAAGADLNDLAAIFEDVVRKKRES
jgi:hypothetical protein